MLNNVFVYFGQSFIIPVGLCLWLDKLLSIHLHISIDRVNNVLKQIDSDVTVKVTSQWKWRHSEWRHSESDVTVKVKSQWKWRHS